MIKGAIIALAVLIIGDLTLNEGQITHHARVSLVNFAAASSSAVNNSVFRQ